MSQREDFCRIKHATVGRVRVSMRVVWTGCALMLGLVAPLGVGSAQPAWVATGWLQPQDSGMAISAPDEYAWRLFVSLNWPARSGAREADSSKKLGDSSRVVWESWMVASGGPKKSAVYKQAGTAPDNWDSAPDPYCDASFRDLAPLQQIRRRGDISTFFEPGVSEVGLDEVRMNKEALEFVTSNNLYYVEGQEALFGSGIKSISFPPNAKEIKAQWREITGAEEARYHSCHYQGKIYGLTAIHILTKDLPNWFWATFEHVDNNSAEKVGVGNKVKANNILSGKLDPVPYEEWMLPSRDAFACPSNQLDCNLAPKGIGLEGTKWQYYRLRGSQVDFVDSVGMPTRLANSNIETGFQPTSSCITCHARASIGPQIAGLKRANRLNIFEPPFNDDAPLAPVGNPDPATFGVTAGDVQSPVFVLKYTQLDFVWSLFRAQRRNP